MKRNLVPLLAVAFVVAIASTGIFYGLFVGKLKSAPTQSVVTAGKALKPGTVIQAADLGSMAWAGSAVPKGMYAGPEQVVGQTVVQSIEAGEPVLESRLASKSGGGGLGIPEGMRAVSVHVSDSSGVLALLRPGHKVDMQVFVNRQGQGENEARTALQNVTVLSAGQQAEPSSQGGFNAPVVTVLATPREADLLGVADSFGRIRLALRNPVDQGKENKSSVPFAAVFRSTAADVPVVATARNQQAPAVPAARKAKSQVGLAVQLLSASPEAMDTLKRYGVSGRQDVLNASPVSQPVDVEKVLAQLRDRKSVDVLSLSRITAAVSRTAAVELLANESGGVRVQFSPFLANGQMKLRVQPELSGGSGTRKLETEVDITSGRSFVISGLKDSTAAPGGRQLLVLVTPNL